MSAQLQHNASLLSNWDTFRELVLEAWDIDDLAKRSAGENELIRLRASLGSVMAFNDSFTVICHDATFLHRPHPRSGLRVKPP
jgi:hypothetical protein